MTTTLRIAAVASCLFGGPAFASSKPSIWQGLYLGGALGGTFGTANLNDGRDLDIDTDADGFVGSGHLGFNVRTGSFVLGIEGDVSSTDASGDVTKAIAPDSLSVRTESDYLVSIRGRLGYIVTPDVLVYGTAGVGFTSLDTTTKFIEIATGDVTTTKIRGNLTGFVVGGGLDWRVMTSISVRAEALYYGFNTDKVTIDGTDIKRDLDITVVRAGLSYHFN